MPFLRGQAGISPIMSRGKHTPNIQDDGFPSCHPSYVRLPPGNAATGDWQKKNPFTLFEHRAKRQRRVCLVLIATQYKWFFFISYILLCLFLYYSADTRTINAMALFSLYLYFFFTYFNFFFFRNSQSQPRVNTTVETFFLPFFHVTFKVVPWFQKTAATFSQFFFRFFIDHGCSASLR